MALLECHLPGHAGVIQVESGLEFLQRFGPLYLHAAERQPRRMGRRRLREARVTPSQRDFVEFGNPPLLLQPPQVGVSEAGVVARPEGSSLPHVVTVERENEGPAIAPKHGAHASIAQGNAFQPFHWRAFIDKIMLSQ